jgi:hypothetical protein
MIEHLCTRDRRAEAYIYGDHSRILAVLPLRLRLARIRLPCFFVAVAFTAELVNRTEMLPLVPTNDGIPMAECGGGDGLRPLCFSCGFHGMMRIDEERLGTAAGTRGRASCEERLANVVAAAVEAGAFVTAGNVL